MTEHESLEKRRIALQRLRERRYEPRCRPDLQSIRPEITKLIQPIDGAKITKVDLLRRYLEIKQMRSQQRKAARRLKANTEAVPPAVSAENAEVLLWDTVSQEKLAPSQKILEQLGGKGFLEHLYKWLYSADMSLDLSVITTDELERSLKETQFRYRMLKIALDLTQQELEAIEVYTRAIDATQAFPHGEI